MKIAFLVNQFPSLSQTFILNQITGLIDRGHAVDIYANEPGDTTALHPDVESYGLLERTQYAVEVPRRRLPRYLRALKGLITHGWRNPKACARAFNPLRIGHSRHSLNLLYAAMRFLPQRSHDVIHCHFGPVGVRGVLLKEMSAVRGKLVTSYYGHDVTRYPLKFGRDCYRKLFETGDLFLVLSQHMRDQLVELGCDKCRVRVHHLGVDCRRLSFAPREPSQNQRLRILTIARFVEKKGLEYAVSAVAKLVESGLKVEHRIVGNGPLFGRMQQLIEQRGVRHCVHLLGWKDQDEVARLLDDADVLLAPSVTSSDGDEEGTPTVLMEAMACGLPVVSTYHSAIPEVVDDGVSGYLVRERDVDALADKLGYLIEHPDLWAKMGRAGRAFVEQHYDINKLNDQLVDLYRKLLERP